VPIESAARDLVSKMVRYESGERVTAAEVGEKCREANGV
jgi:hypothetical protein